MLQCPHCLETVEADAERCPKCGAWLGDATEASEQALESEIRSLLRQGKKIEAIREYRAHTGAGLAEAKNVVEQIERGEPLPEGAPVADDVDQQILDLMAAGQKIAAIKLYRERTGAGLKEAKDAVEGLAARHGIVAQNKTGCFGVLLLLIVAALVLTVA
jgi:ribosomal protein L7/L12